MAKGITYPLFQPELTSSQMLAELSIIQDRGIEVDRLYQNTETLREYWYDDEELAKYGLNKSSSIDELENVYTALIDVYNASHFDLDVKIDEVSKMLVGRRVVVSAQKEKSDELIIRRSTNYACKKAVGQVSLIRFGHFSDYDDRTLLMVIDPSRSIQRRKHIVSPFIPGTLDLGVTIDLL